VQQDKLLYTLHVNKPLTVTSQCLYAYNSTHQGLIQRFATALRQHPEVAQQTTAAVPELSGVAGPIRNLINSTNHPFPRPHPIQKISTRGCLKYAQRVIITEDNSSTMCRNAKHFKVIQSRQATEKFKGMHDRQCTCNVTQKRVPVTICAIEKQVLAIFTPKSPCVIVLFTYS
jgi:hypothetical protein